MKLSSDRDGMFILEGDYHDGCSTTWIWNRDSNSPGFSELTRKRPGGRDALCSMGNTILSPKGGWLASSGDFGIEIFSTEGIPVSRLFVPRDMLCQGAPDSYQACYQPRAWSPDGSRIAGTKHGGPVVIWDVASGTVVDTIDIPGERVKDVEWGKVMVLATQEGQLVGYDDGVVWRRRLGLRDSDSGFMGRLSEDEISRLGLSGDGSLFVAENGISDRLWVLDWKGNEVLVLEGRDALLSPDASRMVFRQRVVPQDGKQQNGIPQHEEDDVVFLDIETKRETLRLEGDNWRFFPDGRTVLWSPSGRYLAISRLLQKNIFTEHVENVYVVDTVNNGITTTRCEIVNKHLLKGSLVPADEVKVVSR
jgi:hypothetical protein